MAQATPQASTEPSTPCEISNCEARAPHSLKEEGLLPTWEYAGGVGTFLLESQSKSSELEVLELKDS